MTTTQVLIVCVAAVLVVGLVALAKWRVRVEELALEERREQALRVIQAADHERNAQHAAALIAGRSRGPNDGAKIGVHVGSHLIRGTRVLRDASEAQGWIVLDDAELLEGNKQTPVGGRQWLHGSQWMQEIN